MLPVRLSTRLLVARKYRETEKKKKKKKDQYLLTSRVRYYVQ